MLGMAIPIHASTKMTALSRVLAVKPGGVASLSYEVKDGVMTVLVMTPFDEDEQAITQPLPAFSMTFDRNEFGKVTNLKMHGVMAEIFVSQFDQINSQLQASGQGLLFPAGEVNIGDSWQGVQRLDMGNGRSVDATVIYTLTGTETVGGKVYLVIRNNISLLATGLTPPVGLFMQPGGNVEVSMKLA